MITALIIPTGLGQLESRNDPPKQTESRLGQAPRGRGCSIELLAYDWAEAPSVALHCRSCGTAHPREQLPHGRRPAIQS